MRNRHRYPLKSSSYKVIHGSQQSGKEEASQPVGRVMRSNPKDMKKFLKIGAAALLALSSVVQADAIEFSDLAGADQVPYDGWTF